MKLRGFLLRLCIISAGLASQQALHAQTDVDADMMAKNLLCVGPMYTSSTWNNYWEGKTRRDNRNLGKVSSQSLSFMGNYGISGKLNVLFNVPYVKTKASAGTLRGMEGVQDLSLFVKWKPLTIKKGHSRLSALAVAGYSAPLSNYPADYLPLSIGMRSSVVSGRLMGDYQYRNLFITASAAYMLRSNISIDRNAYYSDRMYLTDRIDMPDMLNYNLRLGYRTKFVVAEAVLANQTSLGGFDISKNNMPFPSNKMNMTTAGVNLRYIPKRLPDLNFNAGASYTVAGRNVGQASTLYGGVFYIFHFSRKAKAVFQFQN